MWGNSAGKDQMPRVGGDRTHGFSQEGKGINSNRGEGVSTNWAIDALFRKSKKKREQTKISHPE